MEATVKRYGFRKTLPIEVEVKGLEEVKRIPHLFRGPAKADFYQIIRLTGGTAVFDIDFRKVTMNEGEIFILTPGQVYGFDLTSSYEGQMILFTDTFFSHTELDTHFLHTSEILNPIRLNKTVRPDSRFMQNIISLMEKELTRTTDSFQPYIAQSYLRILLLEAERCITGTSPVFHQADMTIGRRFSGEVETHFRQHRQVEFYLHLMGVGEKILSREVKLLTGNTPKVYIASRVILEAKRLLVYGDSSIKEIAVELGFDEPTNFNKFFRKHTGITPLEFRTEQKNRK